MLGRLVMSIGQSTTSRMGGLVDALIKIRIKSKLKD